MRASRILCLLSLFLLSLPVRTQGADTLDHRSAVEARRYRVTGINLEGNAVTKEHIILRELEFKRGDTLTLKHLSYLIDRSESNISNTRLFNFVTIIPFFSDNTVSFTIFVYERWYIWPYLVIENADRNFNVWWENRDFRRLTYGIDLWINNFRGRNEVLQLKAETGFEQTLAAYYSIPFIDRKKQFGIKFGGGYSMNKEVNYGSEENRRLFYRTDSPQRENYYGQLRFTFRDKLYTRQELDLNFNAYSVSDSVRVLGTRYQYLNDNLDHSSFLSLSYTLKHDRRDFIVYPLKGFMFLFTVEKTGLGISPSAPDLLTLYTEIHNHTPLSERVRISNGLYASANLMDPPPYVHQQGLGYGDFVRGYELYVMDAQNYFVSRNNLKFTLVKPRVKNLNFIPIEAFNTAHYALYANIFTDVGYAEDQLYADINPISNKWLAGYGAGLDFVTFYDMIMRVEYSLNIEGERGVFLHFVKPI